MVGWQGVGNKAIKDVQLRLEGGEKFDIILFDLPIL